LQPSIELAADRYFVRAGVSRRSVFDLCGSACLPQQSCGRTVPYISDFSDRAPISLAAGGDGTRERCWNVRRAGVTEALQSLKRRKLIGTGRNHLNRKGIEREARSSYGKPEKEYRRLIG
jgi:hypothetical protein